MGVGRRDGGHERDGGQEGRQAGWGGMIRAGREAGKHEGGMQAPPCVLAL